MYKRQVLRGLRLAGTVIVSEQHARVACDNVRASDATLSQGRVAGSCERVQNVLFFFIITL